MRISVWSSDVSLPICVPGSDRGQFLYRRRTAPALHSHLGRSYRANLPVGRDAGELLHLCEQAPRALHRRSEEHTSELQSLMRISYAVFCLKKKNNNNTLATIVPLSITQTIDNN